jgi:hypothetical protein
MWVLWNLTSFYLETVLVLVQDRWTVCAKRAIGAEIIMDGTDGTPRWRGSSESRVRFEIVLILTQERWTIFVERTLGSEIILDAPDWTPLWHGSMETLFYLFRDSVSISER